MNRRAFVNGSSLAGIEWNAMDGLQIISKIDDLSPGIAFFHVFNTDKKEYATVRSDSMIIMDNTVFTMRPKVLETVFAVCELDCETWTIGWSEEPHSDWDHLWYTWIKGYLIDSDGNINSWALNRKQQAFFFEPKTNTWLHFTNDIPCKYEIDLFNKEEKFMSLDLLNIPKPLKEKLCALAKVITESLLAKEEFEKPYYK